MKKTLIILLTVLMVFAVVACRGNIPENTEHQNSTNASADMDTTPKETIVTPEDTTVTPGEITTESNETDDNTPETTKVPEETTAPETPINESVSTTFDKDNIVFSFGALSDVHIDGASTGTSAQKFKAALQQLYSNAGVSGLDAVCFAGDMLNSGSSSQAKVFSNILKSDLEADTKVFYSSGNHEQLSGKTAPIEFLYDSLGESYFTDDLGSEDDILTGNRHAVMEGYHFIAIEPDNYSSGTNKFSAKTLAWLDAELAKAAADAPGKFIFVFTHLMIYDTCYGSTLYGANSTWNTTELTSTLSRYPQVVTFGGHLHFPLNDERSIMQGAFTSLGCASVSYMAIENGGYVEMASATTMQDRNMVSQGLLIQIDGNGNLLVNRLDFANNKVIKEPWEVAHPDDSGEFLGKYTNNRGRSVFNASPLFNGEPTVTLNGENSLSASLTFPAAWDDDLVHHYIVTLSKNGCVVSTYKILSDFYLYNKPADMKKEYTLSLGMFAADCQYDICVVAYDSWGASSNPVKASVKTGGEVAIGTKLPEPYVDIDSDYNASGKIVDSKE